MLEMDSHFWRLSSLASAGKDMDGNDINDEVSKCVRALIDVVEALLKERDALRAVKDWAGADSVREIIRTLGAEPYDSPGIPSRPEWKCLYGPWNAEMKDISGMSAIKYPLRSWRERGAALQRAHRMMEEEGGLSFDFSFGLNGQVVVQTIVR